MIDNMFLKLFKLLRLSGYRSIFHKLCNREGSLSATEAYAADVIYLLDEPIAGVDPVARDYILDTIIGAHNPESSVVISTHLITDIEPALNEVIMIKYGALALQGDANTLRNTFGKSLNDIFKEVFAGC